MKDEQTAISELSCPDHGGDVRLRCTAEEAPRGGLANFLPHRAAGTRSGSMMVEGKTTLDVRLDR